MLFNSIEFAIFLPIVFILYWFVFHKNIKLQNFFIVVVSYIFYGWWDWRFLFLILFSTVLDYSLGRLLALDEKPKKRKMYLTISVILNLGFLGFFKYCNFFIDNFIAAFTFFGQKPSIHTLNILLPVGISFYTFQTLSYTIDVYKKKLEPTKDFIAFSAFVSFFPQLVAGPIERATHLLPQFYKKREFDYTKAVDGMRQILWGLFKKMVIADNCAVYANQIFASSDTSSGSTLVLGALFFTFQIYGDFSGYSDIAIGTSRLFGFDLMKNFAYPYFSRDVAEFWRRWHISLSTWFRDYLYIPLGGSKGGNWMRIRNTFIIFLVSGFWHGANWTFIVWGFLNALFIMPSIVLKTNRNNIEVVAHDKVLPSLRDIFNMLTTFGLMVFAWIFFRAEDMTHAVSYITNIFKPSLFSFPSLNKAALATLILVGFLLIMEWQGRRGEFALEKFLTNEIKVGIKYPQKLTNIVFFKIGGGNLLIMRWLFYSFLLLLIGLFMQTNETPFIYFQF
ncbi:MBOAT family protein [Riemerella anatipestifer]|nr:MBOAT family O-acyltransferase [Riemerella anatipestifer]MDY3401318.1 MBOAT family protein [Riemerella anatipestifer]MRM84944.1 MBOAT family protein [Riemerella anatipestifer]MRM93950.1 MBOAT family protein [Riemerella anatipestifer]